MNDLLAKLEQANKEQTKWREEKNEWRESAKKQVQESATIAGKAKEKEAQINTVDSNNFIMIFYN